MSTTADGLYHRKWSGWSIGVTHRRLETMVRERHAPIIETCACASYIHERHAAKPRAVYAKRSMCCASRPGGEHCAVAAALRPCHAANSLRNRNENVKSFFAPTGQYSRPQTAIEGIRRLFVIFRPYTIPPLSTPLRD